MIDVFFTPTGVVGLIAGGIAVAVVIVLLRFKRGNKL